jgi:hypothetical protein
VVESNCSSSFLRNAKGLLLRFEGFIKKISDSVLFREFPSLDFFFIVIAVILAKFFPKVSNALLTSRNFTNGQLFGIGAAAIYMFSKRCRTDLSADFWDAMCKKNYLKTSHPSFKEQVDANRDIELAQARLFIDKYGEQAPEKLMEYLNDLGEK